MLAEMRKVSSGLAKLQTAVDKSNQLATQQSTWMKTNLGKRAAETTKSAPGKVAKKQKTAQSNAVI